MNIDDYEEPYALNAESLNARIEEIVQEYAPLDNWVNEWDIIWGDDNWGNWINLPPLPKSGAKQDKTPIVHHP